MQKYLVLLRGINVGGKNKISMSLLRERLESEGFQDVSTYIQSGNVLLRSNFDASTLGQKLENILAANFTLDSAIVRVLVLSQDALQNVVSNKPTGFGELPESYHYDVVFLMGISTEAALQVFNPKEGIDTIWPGNGVIYSQRLSALRTKSRLNKIIGTEAYKSMTIRNWNTTTKLLTLMENDKL